VVAESFPHDGPPPTRRAERARWHDVSWSLRPQEVTGARRWELGAEPRAAVAAPLAPLRRLAPVALGLLLLQVALAALPGARAATAASSRLSAALPAALGLALVAHGCGAAPSSVAAMATIAGAVFEVLLLPAASGARPARRLHRWPALFAGGAVGPLLLLVAARGQAPSRLAGELALLDPTIAAWRLAAVGAVLAVWLFAARFAGQSVALASETSRPTLAFTLAPLAAASLAALLPDHAWPAAVALALAGGGVTAALATGRSASRAGRLGLALAASLVAAAAWSAGERQSEMGRWVERLPSLLPPVAEPLAELSERVERALAELDPSALMPSGDRGAAPEDLAFALWRRTPLARADVLSLLAVATPDGGQSVFSSGLPVDTDGRLDLAPTRWVGVAPAAWIERRVGGEATRRTARQGSWVVRWLAVPVPGFPTGAHAAGSVWAALGQPRESVETVGPEGGRAVLYESSGRIVRSPWAEGTPPLGRDFTASPAFTLYSATPEGPSRVAALSRSGFTAAVFVPLATPLAALERAGSFLAGVWLSGLGLACLVGWMALPWHAIGDQMAHAWRSYSTRLVLVFSAFLLLPIVVASTWVAHAYARQLERQQESSALDAMHAAQRILGEYVLSLEPGFGVGTAVDDRLLEWLARVVRSEVHLYWGSEIYASSKRDLFAAGLLPGRLSGEVWRRIHLDGERVVRRTPPGSPGGVEIYAPLEIPGLAAEATKLVLALPRGAQQGELAAAVAGIRRRAFLVAAALAVLLAVSGAVLARRFARPIEAIVRGTQRIAEGAPSLGYSPDELELEALATAIDRMAARVADARERLLVEKRLVDRIAENVTAAVVGLDSSGRVVFANRLARERLHAAPGEPLVERLRAAGAEALAAALEGAAGGGEPVALRVDLDQGARDWTLVRAALPGPGEPSELVVIEDVTDVVRAQRLDAWAGMARIIAHEIKNPLTPIRLSAEHLREAWARDREHFAAVFDRCTGNILRQVEVLRQTASEFSLYSEIPRIERRVDDLRDAVGEIVEAYRAAPPAGVEIVFDAEAGALLATFDRRLLGRAVRNLIENAVRASAAGGRVEIEIVEGADELAIRVADEGSGVPEGMVSRVVEPYFSTQSGGTGLGLPIARRVAEEHGGRLGLRNRPAGGFEVTLTIPRG
jgi:signal transduction histidine kinase